MSFWKHPTDLARVNAWNAGSLVEHLGMRITEVGDDYVRGTMPVDARTKQPFGLLHGGASVALAETLGSSPATCASTPAKWRSASTSMRTMCARRLRGLVTGTARPLHVGRSTQVWEIRIEDERARLVCISRLTLAVVPRPSPHAI